jgi:hypothetical protein
MSNTKNSLLSCMTKFVSLEEVAQKNHTSATSEMTTLKTTFTNHASCMGTTTEYLAHTAAWAAQAHFTKDDLLEMLLIRKKADTNARRAEAAGADCVENHQRALLMAPRQEPAPPVPAFLNKVQAVPSLFGAEHPPAAGLPNFHQRECKMFIYLAIFCFHFPPILHNTACRDTRGTPWRVFGNPR